MWIPDRFRILNTGVYQPNSGNFGWSTPLNALTSASTKSPVQGWTSCRESFLSTSTTLSSFFYQHGLPAPGRGRSVSVFMDRIEDMLGLEGDNRSRFQKTNKRLIVRVFPGAFWREGSQMTKMCRMSLYSALLRAARHYRMSLNNFDNALWGETYTVGTKLAIQRFLEGNTNYVGTSFTGWYNAFANTTTKASVAQRLVK